MFIMEFEKFKFKKNHVMLLKKEGRNEGCFDAIISNKN